MRKIKTVNIHAGHTKASGKAPGAVGLLNESEEARKIVPKIIKYLKAAGVKVYDCTAEGSDARDNLVKIVEKCNAHAVDLDVSIHLNSGRNDPKGDGKNGGVEVFVHSNKGIAGEVAKDICARVSKLGFTNRGVKVSQELYVLNHTQAPAILVECCFVDDRDDVELYDPETMAKKIANGIVGGVIKNVSK